MNDAAAGRKVDVAAEIEVMNRKERQWTSRSTGFLLAHFGGEAVSGDLGRATWAVLGLGLVTGLPLFWGAMRQKPEKENP
ncbi:hypothetical protein [Roseovarius nitratireducens]|uniref:hypothetical protein n=1 Tax=Roseovarius nitratireducens TaxID=2044597 RepID=UPI001F0BEA25|nr:hypothetical protein [Roseovarius nitratireducens]